MVERVGLTEEDRKLPVDGGIVLGESAELAAHAPVGFRNLAAAIEDQGLPGAEQGPLRGIWAR
jgi:hypothetical protein